MDSIEIIETEFSRETIKEMKINMQKLIKKRKY